MKAAAALLALALLAVACAHYRGPKSNWDKPNAPDAGQELRWGE